MATSRKVRDHLRPNVSGEIADAMIGHQIGLLRYGRSTVEKILDLLAGSREGLRQVLNDRLGRLLQLGYDPGPVTTARVAAQLKWVERFVSDTVGDIRSAVEEDLHQLAAYETRFGEKLLRGAVPIDVSYVKPAPEQLAALVTKLPFNGKFYGEHISDFARWQFSKISSTVQQGVVMGHSLDQIVKGVIGTPGLRFSDGVHTARQARQQAETLVRTSVNHVASQAREELWKANRDLIKGVEWVSVLDGRVTITCASLDGLVFEVGRGPRPPAHPNCRSVTSPVIKSLGELAPDLRAKVPKAPEERARLDGVASGKTTYQTWLRRQSLTMQDFVLGPARAKMYRADPTMQLSTFADDLGRPLTLAQLVDREADLLLKLSDTDIRAMARYIGEQRVKRVLKKKAS